MAIWSRKQILSDAVADWAERGLIDDQTRSDLEQDIGAPKKGLTFTAFVILAGIVCLGFGAISFVAANWDEIPRIARVFVIFGSMWAAWAGAYWAAMREHPWIFECLALLASILYGASIMLIAQLYHIQGPAEGAVMMWAIGALIAGVLTRSGLAIALVFGLLAVWHIMVIGERFDGINAPYLIWWALASVAAWWVKSRFSGHLSVISLGFWAVVVLIVYEIEPVQIALCAGAAMALMVLAFLSADGPRILRGFEGGVVVYLVIFVGGLALLRLSLNGIAYFDEAVAPWWVLGFAVPAFAFAALASVLRIDTSYDAWIAAVMCAGFIFVFTLVPNTWLQSAFTVGLFIWIPRLGWRLDNLGIRVVGMIGFALAMLIVYAVTVGSLIGTSGFYIGAGLILIAGAWIGSRLGRAKPGDEDNSDEGSAEGAL